MYMRCLAKGSGLEIKVMRIGFYQFTPIPKKVKLNLDRIKSALSHIQADLIVLPELCATGYLFTSRSELSKYAEPVPDGPSCMTFLDLCRTYNLNIVFGMAERNSNKIYNTAVLITAEGKVHCYRKAHLFLNEKDRFDPGNTRFQVFQINSTKVGMLICFDYFFPEVARSLALAGAQIICHPSNLVLDYAQKMTFTRAAENRMFWILANRTGREESGAKTITFTGRSQIVGPDGRLLYRAGSDTEELPVIEIAPSDALDKKVTPRNDLFSDRRTDLYQS